MRTGAFSCRRLADIGVTLLTVLVTATPLSAGILDAAWTAPTINADGTALTDLALYRVYYGTTDSVCPGPTSVSVVSPTPAPGADQTVATPITGLTAGTRYYMAVTAVDLGGNTSDCSAVASAVARDDTSIGASLTLTYNGKLRDRVGAANVGVQADGAPDGALTVTLAAAGGRTITRVQLHSSAPGTWDTDASTAAWTLGVATSPDGALLNDAGTSAVNFDVADGGSFQLFAADWSDIEFVPGTTLTVTATFSDGTTASASTVAGTTPGPASLTVGYNGKLRDRVGPGNVGLGADGALDATFTVTLAAVGGRTITRLQLQSSAPGTWDTDAATAAWVLGVATSLDGALLNDAGTSAVNFGVADGGSFQLFAADWSDIEFVPGTMLTVTATFSDGTTASASTVGGTTPGPASLTVGYNGTLRDRVGQGNVGLGADGALDGTLTVRLSATGGRTITRLELHSSAPGSWDTDASTAAWVLGVAATLDGALLNDAATGAVNFAVADGGSFQLFAADWAGVEFASGATLTVTATLSDGSRISGRVTLP